MVSKAELREIFLRLVLKYGGEQDLFLSFWNQIESNYNEKGRFYHNFDHLSNMITELESVKDKIKDWDSVLFAVFYHDLVYKPTQNDNEYQSAFLCEKHLSRLLFSPNINQCKEIILATKTHSIQADTDIHYFLDVDLSILGQELGVYKAYTENIRKEYSMFDSDSYKKGRLAVLIYFLNMESIFKTNYFYDLYEKKARNNLFYELEIISNS